MKYRPMAGGDRPRGEYDLVVLAMQAPHYRSPEIQDLLDRVAEARVPCMSTMNMPPLAYMKRISGIRMRLETVTSAHRRGTGSILLG